LTPASPPTLPAAALRLFPDHAASDLALADAAPFVVGRLLEDGDRADLAWLFGAVSEADAGDWLARRGGRQLSRRSRAFWQLVIGIPGDRPPVPAAGDPSPAAVALWPL